jgi:hypothetical protein
VSLFIEYPALAALLGVLFLGAYWNFRRRIVGIAGWAWLGYAGYEAAMRLRWLCTGECNIRVDLLLIYPVLLVISIVALVALIRGRRTPDR